MKIFQKWSGRLITWVRKKKIILFSVRLPSNQPRIGNNINGVNNSNNNKKHFHFRIHLNFVYIYRKKNCPSFNVKQNTNPKLLGKTRRPYFVVQNEKRENHDDDDRISKNKKQKKKHSNHQFGIRKPKKKKKIESPETQRILIRFECFFLFSLVMVTFSMKSAHYIFCIDRCLFIFFCLSIIIRWRIINQ